MELLHINLVILSVPILTCALPFSDLYPFGLREGDSALAPNDDEATRVNFASGEEFQFFNVTYSHLFVNNNGGLSFSQGVTQFTPTCGPLTQPMIVPFWADVDTRNGGVVHYRESMDREQLRRASTEVSTALPQLAPITLGWMFVVTWHEVAYYGSSSTSCSGISKRNTFQVVLAKDGFHTFVIFNFHKITWTTGKASNGDDCGLGGTPAKSGFDLGDNTTFYTITGSCTPSIINLTQTTNVGKPGKWVFRIDQRVVPAQPSQLDRVRCINATSDRVRVQPSLIPMLGRRMIILSGPCLLGATTIQCIFKDPHDISVQASRISESSVQCRAPYLASEGRIPVMLLVRYNTTPGGSNRKNYTGFIYTFIPKQDLHFNIRNQRSTSSQAYIDVSWNSERFRETTQALEYRLELVALNRGMISWADRGTIKHLYNCHNCTGFNIASGRYQGFADNSEILSSLRSSYFIRLVAVPFQIQSTGRGPQTPRGQRPRNPRQRQRRQAPMLHSPFLHSNYNISSDWFHNQCDRWHNLDVGPPEDVLPCPPTLNQAIIDQNFIMERQRSSRHHHGQFTFRQRLPSPSGAEQQCIYKDGNIFVARHHGGNADLKSAVGPRGAVNHLIADIMPWYWCCAYSTDPTDCDRYYDKRPSNSGGNYISSIPASGKGDPHITTFDQLNYTFNGVGEFWMMKPSNASNSTVLSSTLQVQCRMEQFINANTNLTTNASIFTAFAFHQEIENSTKGIQVQITLSPSGTGTQVSINGEEIPVPSSTTSISDDVIEEEDDEEYYEMPDEISITESGVSITYNITQGSVVFLFSSGFNFEISTSDNRSLSIIASSNIRTEETPEFSGLLGNCDGDPNNDLINPEGVNLPSITDIQDIHINFGSKWRTKEDESIFHYKDGESHSTFQNEAFNPNFEQPDLSAIPEEVVALCGPSKACLFDYLNTGGDRNFAKQTLQTEIKLEKIAQVVGNSKIICDPPPTPEHGWYNLTNHLLGSTVQLVCNEGYVATADSQFSCILEQDSAEMAYGEPSWNFIAIPSCIKKSSIWLPDWLEI